MSRISTCLIFLFILSTSSEVFSHQCPDPSSGNSCDSPPLTKCCPILHEDYFCIADNNSCCDGGACCGGSGKICSNPAPICSSNMCCYTYAPVFCNTKTHPLGCYASNTNCNAPGSQATTSRTQPIAPVSPQMPKSKGK